MKWINTDDLVSISINKRNRKKVERSKKKTQLREKWIVITNSFYCKLIIRLYTSMSVSNGLFGFSQNKKKFSVDICEIRERLF
ncbi:hypothetical protein GCM10028791_37260 [Echinicola sediminis]